MGVRAFSGRRRAASGRSLVNGFARAEHHHLHDHIAQGLGQGAADQVETLLRGEPARRCRRAAIFGSTVSPNRSCSACLQAALPGQVVVAVAGRKISVGGRDSTPSCRRRSGCRRQLGAVCAGTGPGPCRRSGRGSRWRRSAKRW